MTQQLQTSSALWVGSLKRFENFSGNSCYIRRLKNRLTPVGKLLLQDCTRIGISSHTTKPILPPLNPGSPQDILHCADLDKEVLHVME